MKERPILFSGAMVRALRSGTKKQTRRPLRGFSPPSNPEYDSESGRLEWFNGDEVVVGMHCPYGEPGDRLWVREAFSGSIAYERHGYPLREWGNKIWYWADGNPQRGDWTKPRPSIHMPRHLSRINLEITGVRVERLGQITENDATAEGIVQMPCGGYGLPDGEHYHAASARASYLSLFESINGPGSVAADPFVWVIEFNVS